MNEEPQVATADEPTPRPAQKRSWRSKLLELALWAALSIATAVIMIALSNRLLPNNF